MSGRNPIYWKLRFVAIATVILTLSSFLMLQSESASAQDQEATASSTLAADLARTIQAQARAALERHLKPEEFQAFARVTPAATEPQKIPYLPETLAPIAGPETTPEMLSPLIQRIELEVLISDQYDEAATAKLKIILQKSLGLQESRGDTVTFSPLGIRVERAESAVARELSRTEADARAARTERDQIAREREDAKREVESIKRDLTLAKNELDRVVREQTGRNAPTSSDPNKPSDQSSAASTASADRGFFRENLSVFVAAVIALLAIFMASFVLRAGARTLSDAVRSIGTGLPLIADKLSESFAQKPALLPSADASRNSDLQTSAPTGLAHLATLPMESVAKRVLELNDEMLVAVGEHNEGLVINYLSRLLDDHKQVERVVATMELLGKDRANQFYNRLRLGHQQVILEFLKAGRYSRPKGEIIIEAGESLKTELFGADFANRADLEPALIEKLWLLDRAEQIAVARTLDGEALARFFLYLEAPQLTEILQGLREKEPKKFDKAALTIVKMPEVEAAKHLDHEVQAAIEAQLVRASNDIQAAYLPLYRQLVELADDEMAESLAEHFAAAHPRIDRYIRESVVTVGTFFKLHSDIQEEIVTGLSNKDLAAIVSMLKPELKANIFTHIEERRKELIEEESDRLAARGQRQIIQAHRIGKRQLLDRMIQIKGQASLTELFAQPTEGPPAPATQGGSKAA